MSQSAEVPKPPADEELRNIIDKLAQFVAKNGPEFENMTKQKQKDNPKFAFLYGGEYFHYYMYRVTVEQALARKRQAEQQQQSNIPQSKIQMLQAQIQESERNLRAQYDVLMKQQEHEINEGIRVAMDRQIFQVAEELRLNLSDLSRFVDGMAYPYAQDTHDTAANWIMSHYLSPRHGEAIIRYLLERIKDSREYFPRKLSMLYLINGLVQRSKAGQQHHVLEMLNKFAPIMFCFVMKLHGQEDASRSEMDQLLRLWYELGFLNDVGQWRCRNIDETVTQYQNELRGEYAGIVSDVMQRIQNQYRQYEMQHHEFSKHMQQQIASEQYQSQSAAAIPSLLQQRIPSPPADIGGSIIVQKQQQPPSQPRRSRFDDPGPAAFAAAKSNPPPPSLIHPMAQPSTGAAPPPGVSPWQQPPPIGHGPAPGVYNQPPSNISPPSMAHFPSQQQPPFQPRPWHPPPQGPWTAGPPSGPPATQQPPVPFGPALPPPGLGIAQPTKQPLIPPVIDEQSLIPKVAYYDLPAGLMAPLIKMEEHDYKPLKPGDLRLPPPMPPSDRLLAAVEAFYAPPNHENPRDSEGWERLGLYEYYKEKAKATQRSSKSKNEASDGKRNDDGRHHSARNARDESSDSAEESHERRRGRRRSRSSSGSRDSRSPSRDSDRKRSSRHRSRRSHSRDSRDDSKSSRSSSRHHSDSRDSGSRSPSPRHKSSRRKDNDSDRHSRRRSRDRDESSRTYSGDEADNERMHRGLGSRPSDTAEYQPIPTAPGSDPFEQFRRAQAAGFNQRLKASFQVQPR